MQKLLFNSLILISILMVGGVDATSLSESMAILPGYGMTIIQQETKTKIKLEQLPDAVQTAFETSDYKALQVSSVFEILDKDRKIYQLIVDDGSQKWSLLYSAEGSLIEEKKVG